MRRRRFRCGLDAGDLLEARLLLSGAAAVRPAAAVVGPHAATAGDYDGDGKADLVVYDAATAQWSIGGSAAGNVALPFGSPRLDIPVVGDFDGDGQMDPAVYRPSTGQWIIDRSSRGPEVISFGAPGLDVPVPADYDGDGTTDLAVYRPSTAQWFIWGSTSGPRAQQFGAPGVDVPVPADYDGDGKADIAVYRPSTAQWFLWGSTAGPRAQQFGAPGVDLPVPADYDGDGKVDIAVYRLTTAQWFVWGSAVGPMSRQFGTPGLDVPVPADYDGDGKADLAVYRPDIAQFLFPRPAGAGFPQGTVVAGVGATAGQREDEPPLAPLEFRSAWWATATIAPYRRTDPYAVARHQQHLAQTSGSGGDVVFFGDSITDRWVLDPASLAVWNAQIAPLGALDFGVLGDRSQDLLWRLENDELAGQPKVAVVMIGTNDTAPLSPVQVAAGIIADVETIRRLSPGTKVLLMGLLPRGLQPTDPERQFVAAVNALIAGVADGTMIRYLDIGGSFLRPDGTLATDLLFDGVHPTAAGYQIWANAIVGPLHALLGQPSPAPGGGTTSPTAPGPTGAT